jgi:transcriptional regulator with XRE-family HTH domain/tetratricopeptide (TPR) repeat protein
MPMAELADFLTSPEARAALAQRDITTVYRLLCEAGITQARIGRATGQGPNEVSEIISGRRVSSIALLERIADGFGVPPGWMGLAYTPGLVPEAPDKAQAADENDDNLLRHAGTVLFSRPVFGPADPICVQVAPTPVPDRIGLADVEQVASTTGRLSQLFGDYGGISASAALTAHAQASEALLSAAMREPVRQRLLTMLADAHSSAGWAAGDAGLRDLSRQHFSRGMDCAGAAGGMLEASANLYGEGRMEMHFGHPNDALKVFQLGAATAPTPLARARFECHCAWALAELGLEGESLAALHRACDARNAASSETEQSEGFRGGLWHVEGCTYLALGRFDRAVVALSAAMDGASHAVRCTTINSCRLAVAQLRCGELRVGLQTAARVVDKAGSLRSVWVRDVLAPLQEAAEARRDSACRDLAHELATLRNAA